MDYGTQLLSKALDDGTLRELTQYRVEREDFVTETERKVYDMITNYATTDGGLPSAELVASQVPEFGYVSGVTDSARYLAAQLKDVRAKRELHVLLTSSDLSENFQRLPAEKFASQLSDAVNSIKLRTGVRNNGVELRTVAEDFSNEYQRRKTGQSFKRWESKFDVINSHAGGYYSGNMYTWFGRSGRGKSMMSSIEESIHVAMQGGTVLVWSLEMSWYEVLARMLTSLSARFGTTGKTLDGNAQGIDQQALLSGQLDDEQERALDMLFGAYMAQIPGNVVIRGADDPALITRTVDDLEADILATGADFVVVDPIYLMDFDANTSRVAGGDVANTSKRLRRMAGRLQTVLVIVTQADEDNSDKADEDGVRTPKPPARSEVKKSKAILEDSALLIAFDSADGAGVIEISKGRNGGEGKRADIIFLPRYGVIKQLTSDQIFARVF